MGASMSSWATGMTEADSVAVGPTLGDIPEGCIAKVLGHLDPPEICQLARVNRAFHRASSADFIWESKLPTTYPFLVHNIIMDNNNNNNNNNNNDNNNDDGKLFTKKDIFARLSRPNLFDSATKEIWLDKNTGGVCLSISSKALSITGIDDRRYWNFLPTYESRFQTVAYLLQIWWFEVCGELSFKFPIGTYSLFFRLQLGRSCKKYNRRTCNLEHIHGWDIRPVKFQLTTSDNQRATSQCFLHSAGSWVLYYVGDFVIRDPNKRVKIKFSMTQIDCTHIKGGLSLDCVMIQPKDYLANCKEVS